MSKVLFITLTGTGRINPTLPLVKELVLRGEDVTYISSEIYQDKIEATGANFWRITDPEVLKDDSLPMVPIHAINAVLSLIFNAQKTFDYIIYDSNFIIGDEVGRVLGIPTICSITTFAANSEVDVFNVTQHYERNQERLSAYDTYNEFVKGLKDLYDINFPSVLTAAAPVGMMKLVYTSRHFQISGEAFDDSYKFIGPSLKDATHPSSSTLSLSKGKQKLLYISLGTIFNKSLEFYDNCFKAFDNLDATVVMSVGNKTDMSTFEVIPSHFIVKQHVNQLAVLSQADAFITHAGMNSTNEALYHGVPLILIPQAGDQPFVAKRVVDLGAGLMLDKNNTSPEVLKSAVQTILTNEAYKMNSLTVGETLKASGGYKKGVDEILNFYASHPTYQSIK